MGVVKEQKKDKFRSIRLTQLQSKRIVKLAGERQWSVSHMIQFIIDEYCDRLFLKDSEEFK